MHRIALALLLAGCTAHEPDPAVRDVEMIHELCTPVTPIDIDDDARPDLVRGAAPDGTTCTSFDLNLDGVADQHVYLDAQLRDRRRESDLDGDGHIDEISHLLAGVVSRIDRDLDGDHRVDTWDLREHGNLARRERDSDGNGRVDQWWTFPTAGCPLIARDGDGDGRPDGPPAPEPCD